jgi:hypothetical protein
MALTRVSDNQIAESTSAVLTTLSFLNTDSVFRLPSGNTAQQPGSPATGTLRFNTENDNAEIYVSDADGQGNPGWTEVAGGGPSVGNDAMIRTNGVHLTENTTVGPVANGDEQFTYGLHMGDMIIDPGITLTIENGAGLQLLAVDEPIVYESRLFSRGSLIQIAYDQSTVEQTITNTDNIGDFGTYLEGLQILDFRPKRSDSIIVLEASISHSNSHIVSFGFLVNNVPVANLSSNTNTSGSNVTWYNGGNNPERITTTNWKISPTNPGAGVSMDIRVGGTASWAGAQTSYPLYINNRSNGDTRSISSITAYEIAQ